MSQLFLTVLAIIWFMYRLCQFLTIPLLEIVKYLKIKTPYATKVSIDKITTNSITVHWENEPEDNTNNKTLSENPNKSKELEKDTNAHISHYILYLNNVEVAISPNSPDSLYTCLSINGLKPNTEYQIDFVTVNYIGFINKPPSIHCMTKNKDNDTIKTINNNWKRNTTPAGNSILTDTVPTYTSLTELKDLENYSITDLKKILTCSQEDLHYITLQRSTLLNDFQDSNLQLQLELDNLKNNCYHEIELHKSLKSSIKSLENSKSLYDLKISKLNKKIEDLNSKIFKMQNDMSTWSNEKSTTNELREKFNKKISEYKADNKDIKEKNLNLKNEVIERESTNKELYLNKSQVDITEDISKILKELNQNISEETGLLNSVGHSILSKLTASSTFYNLITDQLNVDSKLNSNWSREKKNYVKRIASLENILNQVGMQNSQLRSKILIQPYSNYQKQHSISSPNSGIGLNTLSDFNSSKSPNINGRNFVDGISNDQQINSEAINSQIPLNNRPIFTFDDEQAQQQQYQSPPPSARGSLLSNQMNSIKNQFTHSIPTTATVTEHATASPNDIDPVNSELTNDSLESDQQLDYDTTNHVITSLKDMIFEDSDNLDHVSNYSKGFTTDQLDSYWTNQSKSVGHSRSHKMDNISPPQQQTAMSFNNNNEFISPISSNSVPFNPYMRTMPSSSATGNNSINQHILSGSYNDNAIGPFSESLSIRNSNSYYGVPDYNSPPHMADINPADDHLSLLNNLQDSLNLSNINTLNDQQKPSTSRAHNFIWNTSPSKSQDARSDEGSTSTKSKWFSKKNKKKIAK